MIYDIIQLIRKTAFAVCFCFYNPLWRAFLFPKDLIMKTSDNGINVLKQLEGCVKNNNVHVIYNDKTGQQINPNKSLPRGATIGYGHLIKKGEFFENGITEAKATELLRKDLEAAEKAVCDNIKIRLTQNQFDALVIFAFNIGVNNFANSTVIKYINNPKFHSVQYSTLKSAWMAWNKSGGHKMVGLIKRRIKEFELFTNGSVWKY